MKTVMERWKHVKMNAVKAWDQMASAALEAAEIIKARTGQDAVYWQIPFGWGYRAMSPEYPVTTSGLGVEFFISIEPSGTTYWTACRGRKPDGWFKDKENDLSGLAHTPHTLSQCEAAVAAALTMTTGDFIKSWELNQNK